MSTNCTEAPSTQIYVAVPANESYSIANVYSRTRGGGGLGKERTSTLVGKQSRWKGQRAGNDSARAVRREGIESGPRPDLWSVRFTVEPRGTRNEPSLDHSSRSLESFCRFSKIKANTWSSSIAGASSSSSAKCLASTVSASWFPWKNVKQLRPGGSKPDPSRIQLESRWDPLGWIWDTRSRVLRVGRDRKCVGTRSRWCPRWWRKCESLSRRVCASLMQQSWRRVRLIFSGRISEDVSDKTGRVT